MNGHADYTGKVNHTEIEEISFSFIAKMFEINKKIKRHN